MKATALIFILTAAVAMAEPIEVATLTANGKTYQKCKVEKIDATFARVTHEEGIARVPMTTLPEEVRTKLGYNEKKDVRLRKQIITESVKSDAKAKLQRASQTMKLTIDLITPEGLYGRATCYDQKGQYLSSGKVFLEINTTGMGVVTDKTYSFDACPAGTKRIDVGDGEIAVAAFVELNQALFAVQHPEAN